MDITNEIKFKADLLCKGMRVTDGAKEKLLSEFPDFFTKGIMHSINIKFAKKSPYLLTETDGEFEITDGEYTFPVGFFGALPHTGTVVDNFARLHSTGCVTIWPSSNCCYDKPNEKCKFCSIVKEAEVPLNPKSLADGIKALFEKSSGNMLNFSGGTYKNPDNMCDYWVKLVTEIRTFSTCPIAIEFAPPSDLNKLLSLKNAGVNVVIMNLEVADDALRQKLCPGKAKIPYQHYYSAFRKAVELFGWGQVSCVLIAGIQSADSIIAECEKLASIGVFPTVMPIRPLDNAVVGLDVTCDHDDLKRIAMHLARLLHKYNLDFKKQEGCTKCGGCSIENDCYRLLAE